MGGQFSCLNFSQDCINLTRLVMHLRVCNENTVIHNLREERLLLDENILHTLQRI